jgi:hypothetical protein
MEDTHADSNKPVDEQENRDSQGAEFAEITADAVMEVTSEAGIKIGREEAVKIAEELLEEFTSPLMIAKSAGASGSVTITTGPTGEVEGGRSIKARNIQVNLKDAAFRLPSAVLALYEKLGTSGQSTEQFAVGAILSLFGMLQIMSDLLKVPLTQQTAAVLHRMWMIKNEDETAVPHDGLLERVNSQFELYGWKKLDAEGLISHLETLERLDCIERNADSILVENIRWELKERVKVSS